MREEPDGQNNVYLVRETKGTTGRLKIPEIQRKTIQCGKAHFKAVGLKEGGDNWVVSAAKFRPPSCLISLSAAFVLTGAVHASRATP